MYEKETITQIELARHDAAARDVYPHALWGGAWAQTPSRPSIGNGDVDNPFQISIAAELAWFRDYVNGKIVNEGEKDGTTHPSASATLTADIDLVEFCHAADAATNTKELSWDPIGNSDNKYQGTFDGNGKTISNLYINVTSGYAGFFGYANEGGCIKNITFDNAKVKSTNDDYCIGILVGAAGSCIENIKTLVNCSVEGKNYVGGIVGMAKGNISNCENHAMVKGSYTVGGVVGCYDGSSKSISSCANYGAVTGTSRVGGMVGHFSTGTIQNSANYGDITGTYYVGNLIGNAQICYLDNVLGTGNVTATWNREYAGLLVGYIGNSSSTASGILAYNSSAKLTINKIEQTGNAVKAIGYGSLTYPEKIKAFSEEQLKSGLVAFLLQKNVSGSAKWGQKLNTDDHPLLGSADEVYLDGNMTMNCLGELVGTGTFTFTNTKPAQEGTLTIKHGDSPVHHKSVDATCTTDGNIEYWECNLCHKFFSDEQMTQEVSNLVVSATGHEYDENDKCTKCQQEIPFLTKGDNAITIGKVSGTKEEISGYNLYKYTAPEDGILDVTANSNGKVTNGTLWESRTATSYLTYNDFGNGRDFKITYYVTKGTTYYIGARQYSGDAIEGNVTFNVKLTQLPAGMTGNGSEAKPFVLKTADHLAWFRDYVNGGHPNAWAKIADDVKEIDMSTVCHEANTATNTKELSWNPIGNSDISYQGTFDGKGKTISNLYINAISENTGFIGYAGFFGYVDAGSIKNITFNNAKVNSTGFRSTGILAGGAGSCIIEDIKTLASCSVEGIDNVGGIVGMAKGNISNCENHAAVKGAEYVGGIAGWYDGSDNSITSCANYGVVTGSGNNVGGMVGYFRSGTIQNSANYGNITGYEYVGNLIGNAIECNLNNVLGTGNVTATSRVLAGLLVGRINYASSCTASGILAYNSSAKLTINKTEQTDGAVKAIGQGSLTYPEGMNEADVIKVFNPEQLKSGEVAYLLNGSKSEGELAWYQKLLGAEADAYPVLTAAEGNTVYKVSYCDGTDSSYSNSSSENELVHVASATLTSPVFDSAKLIYHMGCSNESCPEHKYVADADGTLEATKSTDGKFYVEELNLTDASTAINTQAQFIVKDLQYSRQLKEGQKGYVTLCLPFDINVANVTGVEKCYPVGDMMIHMPTEDASVLKFVLMLDEQSVIKAGTPMIVKLGAEGTAQKLVAKAQNVEYNAASAAKSLTLRDWDGKTGFMTLCHELESASIGGVYTTTPMAEGSYSFREDGKFGIHTGDLSPYRMYLNVQPSQSASSRTMLFSIGLPDDSSTTGIRIISLGDGKQTGSSAIYTLEGQRVMGTPRKGIYIKNGKKFSVK